MSPQEPPPGPYTKQRRAIRHYVGAAVEITDPESGRTKVALVRALNAYGCFVKTDMPFRVGARVALTITHAGSHFSVSGRVVSRLADRANKGIGVEFAIDSIERDQLEGYLADLHREEKLASFASLKKKLRIHTRESRGGSGEQDPPTYAWQQAVLDAFRSSLDSLPAKINVAEQAISARLADADDAEMEEQLALKGALRFLRVLLEERLPSAPAKEKKDTG